MFILNYRNNIIHTVLLELEICSFKGKIILITIQTRETHEQLGRIMISSFTELVTDPFHTGKITSTKTSATNKQINTRKPGTEEEAQMNLNCAESQNQSN